MLQNKGHDISAFIPDDPNLRGENARYLQSVLAGVSGGGGGNQIWNTVKPIAKAVGKTALRAVPIAGAGVSLAQANEYRKAGQDKLAAAATMSAVPGPWGWAGLAGEMGGLLWNKATQDPNFLYGPLDKRRHIPRQRGSL